MIQHYGLHSSKDMRIDDKVRKGYERAWFEDTWSRFCPPKPPSPPIPDPLPATPATSLTDKEMQPDFDPQHDTEPWDPDPLQDNGCSDVAGNGAGVGATGPSAPLNPDDDPNFEPDRDFEVF